MNKRLDKLEIRLYNGGTPQRLQHLYYKVTLETRPKLTALLQKIPTLLQKILESSLNYFTTPTLAKCMCISIYYIGGGWPLVPPTLEDSEKHLNYMRISESL